MVNIIFPTNTEEVIDGIRGAIGRPVDFYVVESTDPCPVCNLDPTTNTSTDSFCPVCSGVFWMNTYGAHTISGHVTHGGEDLPLWVTGGRLFKGDARVQIKYTTENLDIVSRTEWLEVDGKTFTINEVIPRGVQNLNRLLIDLKELSR